MSDTNVEPTDPPPDLGALSGAQSDDLGALASAGGEVSAGAGVKPPKSSAFDALIERTSRGPDPAVQQQFVDLKAKQIEAFQRQQANEQRLETEDRARVQEAFNAEQATIDHTPKWDAEAERAKYRTDPIQEFGSLGSVFAMVASAFTRAPMINALNGAAAAINAKRDSNEKEYDRALEAFKVNSDLVIKRFNMQHTALGDAFTLMDRDANRGHAKLLEEMTKYGMEKELMLYQNGFIPEIQQSDAAQVNMVMGIERLKNEMDKTGDQKRRTDISEKRDQLRAEIERQKLVVGAEKDQAKRTLEEKKLEGLNSRFMQTYDLNERKQGETERHNEATEDVAQKRAAAAVTHQPVVTPDRRIALEKERRVKFDAEHPDKSGPEWDAENARRAVWTNTEESVNREAAKPKNFTAGEMKLMEAAPLLMGHLQVMHNLADGVVNPLYGVPAGIAAKYLGINDPAILYHAAHANAEAEMTSLSAGSRVPVAGLKKLWATIPEAYNASRFAKVQLRQAMQDLSSVSQTNLSLIESEGKKIPQTVYDKFLPIGVFPESQKSKDPRIIFQRDPTAVPDDDLLNMVRYRQTLSPEDQQKLAAEIQRRKALEKQQAQ